MEAPVKPDIPFVLDYLFITQTTHVRNQRQGRCGILDRITGRNYFSPGDFTAGHCKLLSSSLRRKDGLPRL